MKAILFACAASVFALGCGSDNTVFLVPNGTLVVDWTVATTKDPNACSANGATTIDIVLKTTTGVFIGEFQQDCEAFATSISLAVGNYTGTATLLDSSGAPRTTAVNLGAFSIFGGDQVVLPINFPRVSFF
jgi:hypothetical protein